MNSRLRGLLLASHPAPSAAVTVLATVLFISAGNPARTCLIGALALLTGQLSIGWSNDLIDRRRDIGAHRTDKPLAVGSIEVATLRRACGTALVLSIPTSLGLGWRAGLLHLAAVGAGWAYNLGLKSRLGSPLPYLAAFAALPVIATEALPEHRLPPLWIIVAAGLIGAGAHFGNVLPDLPDDLAAGVRGLPQRLGSTGAAIGAGLLTLAATALVLLANPGWPAIAVGAGVLVLVAIGLHASIRGRRPAITFYLIMASAAGNVALIAASGALS
ncbi:MAG: UbiA family prenyltransferase [Jatrophihabitantaceae bacterium]